jgi:iron only hydrogenase large subunit-like protein
MALRQLCTEEILCVFIGPCIAKKLEARDPGAPAVIDEVLTFKELRALFTQRGVLPAKTEPQPFDPPTAGMGRAFPLSGGLLKSAKLEADLLDPRIITISGQQRGDRHPRGDRPGGNRTLPDRTLIVPGVATTARG